MTILDDAREGMDATVRPQDDLFGYVNGTWLRTEDIPSDRSSWGPFVQLADNAEAQVREIIEGAAGSTGENAAELDKIARLYASFMNTEAIDAKGLEPLKPLLALVDALRDTGDLAAFLGKR